MLFTIPTFMVTNSQVKYASINSTNKYVIFFHSNIFPSESTPYNPSSNEKKKDYKLQSCDTNLYLSSHN